MNTVSFEQEKNAKALILTIVFCGAIFLCFILIRWTLPNLTPASTGEGIEINLGNSDMGLGEAPVSAPAPINEERTVATSAATPPTASKTEDIQASQDEQEDIVHTPIKTEKKTSPKKQITKVVVPVAPKPKAIFKLGDMSTQKSGTAQDGYTNNHSQGLVMGKGIQGAKNGTPNSDSYSGNMGQGGNGSSNGIKMSNNLLQRGTAYIPSLSTDENWRGTIVLRITVDGQGQVVAAEKETKGTSPTLSEAAIQFAIQKVKSFKYNPSNNDLEVGQVYLQFRY
ncbi:MAG: hypothetical protein QM528_01180 [Phycisphaerales bacterium]|nr:hypothetical protein [Phycisphaerales bacterium]